MDDPDLASAKAELREELLADRRALSAAELADARSRVRAQVLENVDAAAVGCVAAYVPLRTEPGSVELLAGLRDRRVRVLVPVTLPDRDLDWAEWAPGADGSPVGRDAIAEAGLVLVPALAAARTDGTRLGRGGGSYDRALRRVAAGVPTVALLFDGEVREELPRGPLDVPVTGALTPAGWVALGGNVDFPFRR